jgi:hypothetical protein
MHSRWYNAAVVVLWLSTMSWLVVAKVLPQLLIGDRPSNRDVLSAQTDSPPAGWRILMGDRRLGWALTEVVSRSDGLKEIHGWVHLVKFPLEKMLPPVLQPIFQLLGRPADILRVDAMDARSTLTLDAMDNLLQLDSRVRLEPLGEVISARGLVEGGKLGLLVCCFGSSFNYEIPVPPKALFTDLLSPQSQLPGLRDGQRWSDPVYNPLRPNDPVEIIFASVEGIDQKMWGGGPPVSAWRVVYRSEPEGGAAAGDESVRGIVWVRRSNGRVIQQQVRLSGTTIDFDRLTRREAADLVKTAGENWWTFEDPPRAKRHD